MHEPLLDPHEVSRILHVSRSYVYQILRRGDLPGLRLGSALRVHPADLEAYIRRKRLHPASDSLRLLRARRQHS